MEVTRAESRGEEMPKRWRSPRAPVPPLCAPPPVAEPLHQLTPCGGDAGQVPPGFGWLVGESKSRKRRNDYMERIPCATTMLCRIGKRPNDLNELRNRSRPTVSQEDG